MRFKKKSHCQDFKPWGRGTGASDPIPVPCGSPVRRIAFTGYKRYNWGARAQQKDTKFGQLGPKVDLTNLHK